MTPIPCPRAPLGCEACEPCPWCYRGDAALPRVYTVRVEESGRARAECAGCRGDGYAHEEARA